MSLILAIIDCVAAVCATEYFYVIFGIIAFVGVVTILKIFLKGV